MRRFIFRVHLGIGLLAGLFIACMCLTGALLSFESELVGWAEAEVRQIEIPADSVRLPLAELQRRAKEQLPEKKPTAIVLNTRADQAIVFQYGREETYYANPYTGELRTLKTHRVRDFLGFVEQLHRWLALKEQSKNVGKTITGISCLLFFLLCLSGFILWWPKHWHWRTLKMILRPRTNLKGKARQWNWHTSLGFWALPALIVITASGLTLAFPWASALLYQLNGEQPPLRKEARPETALQLSFKEAQPLSLDDVVVIATQAVPDWKKLTFRLQSGSRGSRPQPAKEDRKTAEKTERKSTREAAQITSDGEKLREAARVQPKGETKAKGLAPFTVQLQSAKAWPRTATTTLLLDPYSGEKLKVETFATQSAGRRLQSWMRFLHTGEALGITGKTLALLASLVGLMLVYTGFALSWRRFFGKATK